MRCPECVVGQIPFGARVCPSCGYRVAPGDTEAAWAKDADAGAALEAEERDVAGGPRRGAGASRTLALLLGLLLGGAGMWVAVVHGYVASPAVPPPPVDSVALSGFITDSTALNRLAYDAPRSAARSGARADTIDAPAAPPPARRTATAPAPPPRPTAHVRAAPPPPARRRAAPVRAVHADDSPAAPPPETVSAAPPEPAHLAVSAVPWGFVYLDNLPVGNTPILDMAVEPGRHRLRVERDGFETYEREIDVAPGQRLRLTDIALSRRGGAR